MKAAKSLLRKINDTTCKESGYLLGACSTSMHGNKNYLVLVGGSTIVQYFIPFLMMLFIAPFLIANAIVINVIEFLRFFNPFFVVMYLPVTFVDAIVVSIILIAFLLGSVVYWFYFFKEIGIYMLIPFGVWVLAILLWFIPIVGPILSILVSVFPWLPLMSMVHWWVYN